MLKRVISTSLVRGARTLAEFRLDASAYFDPAFIEKSLEVVCVCSAFVAIIRTPDRSACWTRGSPLRRSTCASAYYIAFNMTMMGSGQRAPSVGGPRELGHSLQLGDLYAERRWFAHLPFPRIRRRSPAAASKFLWIAETSTHSYVKLNPSSRKLSS